jgi:inhibitor of the pro-sigma K processing machinery
MRVPWPVVLAFGAGLGLIWLLGRLFLVPRRFLWRLFTSAVLGGICLWAVNLIGARWNYSLPVNPLTALCAGLLGLPGVGLVAALKQLL